MAERDSGSSVRGAAHDRCLRDSGSVEPGGAVLYRGSGNLRGILYGRRTGFHAVWIPNGKASVDGGTAVFDLFVNF